MSQRCSGMSTTLLHDTDPSRSGLPRKCIAICVALLLACHAAGCSCMPKSQKCVMPADDHSYSPLTPFGHYETHWNTWPTDCDDEDVASGETVAAPKAADASTGTLPEPSDGVAPSPEGGSTDDPLGDLLLPVQPDNNPKAAPMQNAPPSAPEGGPATPGTPPSDPLGTPPGGNLPEVPPAGSELPKSTLPPLPDTDALKPTGELLPDSLLPKDDAPMTPKADDDERKKKSTPLEPPKQSRIPKNDLRGPRLSATPARVTPELEFPENRVRKASADLETKSQPAPQKKEATAAPGWRGKSADATTQPEDSAGKWQGRKTTTPSVNRQASHLQNVDRAAPIKRSTTIERASASESSEPVQSNGNPLR